MRYIWEASDIRAGRRFKTMGAGKDKEGGRQWIIGYCDMTRSEKRNRPENLGQKLYCLIDLADGMIGEHMNTHQIAATLDQMNAIPLVIE